MLSWWKKKEIIVPVVQIRVNILYEFDNAIATIDVGDNTLQNQLIGYQFGLYFNHQDFSLAKVDDNPMWYSCNVEMNEKFNTRKRPYIRFSGYTRNNLQAFPRLVKLHFTQNKNYSASLNISAAPISDNVKYKWGFTFVDSENIPQNIEKFKVICFESKK